MHSVCTSEFQRVLFGSEKSACKKRPKHLTIFTLTKHLPLLTFKIIHNNIRNNIAKTTFISRNFKAKTFNEI